MADRYRREFRLWGSTPDRDADDEIRFHIEMRVAELVQSGMSEPAARAEAARVFGNQADVRREVRAIDRQTSRRLQLTTWLLDLRQDVVAALRQFRKAPGFAAAAVLTIALGIGATTAIFGVVNAVVLRPLPFAEPDRVVLVQGVWRGQPSDVSAGNFVDWRAATREVFSHMAVANYVSVNITGGSSPERVRPTRRCSARPSASTTGRMSSSASCRRRSTTSPKRKRSGCRLPSRPNARPCTTSTF